MSVAAALVGAWKRSGLLVDGLRVPDPCDVLWLQSAETYADIRLPLDPGATPETPGGPAGLFARASAFAGAAHWEPPSMVWEHALDAHPRGGTDQGTLDLSRDGWAYEDGTVTWEGRPVPFREEWERISTPADPVHVEATAGRISVTVGRWRIDVGDGRPAGEFRAERFERRGATWELVGTVTAP